MKKALNAALAFASILALSACAGIAPTYHANSQYKGESVNDAFQ